MSTTLTVPKISEDADSGTVAEIYVSPGDTLEEGQSIIAVDSDKASVDIPAEAAGTVAEIKVSEGDEVKTGDAILTLEEAAEEASGESQEEPSSSEPEGEAEAEASSSASEPGQETSKLEQAPAAESEEAKEEDEAPADQTSESREKPGAQEEAADEPADSSGSGSLEDSPSAPLAKQFARELGIDIQDVPASGERVTRDDVMAYAKGLIRQGNGQQQSPAPASGRGGLHPIQLPDFSKFGDTAREPLSSVRSAVATNTLQSWQNIPHVTHHDKADACQLEQFRQAQNYSLTAVIVKIVGEALMRFPLFNASLDMENEEVVYKEYYNIGVAVDTDKGLLMPVLKAVDQKSIRELSEELSELAQQARNGELKPGQMQGGNFVVSNLGGIGGTHFTPVIFPPQAAILGISSTQTEARYEEGGFHPRPMIPLSLSYDHRLIDGADAARFVRWLCEVMEQPLRLLE